MTDLIPAPRPVPTPEERMRDARTDHTFATYLDRTERDQLDARAACAEQERGDALDDRDTARAEAANLRRELDKANAGRQKLQEQLDTQTAVAQGNKRHVAYLTTVIEAIANVEPHIHNGDTTEDNCSPYCPGCRIRTAMNTTIDAPSAGLGSPSPRAQDARCKCPAGLCRCRNHEDELAAEVACLGDALDQIGAAVEAGAGDIRPGIRSILRRARPEAINLWAPLAALRAQEAPPCRGCHACSGGPAEREDRP